MECLPSICGRKMKKKDLFLGEICELNVVQNHWTGSIKIEQVQWSTLQVMVLKHECKLVKSKESNCSFYYFQ